MVRIIQIPHHHGYRLPADVISLFLVLNDGAFDTTVVMVDF
jgi:hypothetical protein